MSDFIDRQAAIDEISKRIKSATNWANRADDPEIKIRAEQTISAFCEVSLMLKSLPPAPPIAKDINVPVSDCISRQAAIEALCDDCPRVQSVCPHYPCREYLKIEELPSVQPEQIARDIATILENEHDMRIMLKNAESTQDCISRQSAIDALCKAGCESGYCGISCDDVKAIELLPSVQERKGQWIKHNDYLGWAYLCSECNHFLTIKYNYCPNCGAKMEGAEDAGRSDE